MIKRVELTGFQSHLHTVFDLAPGLNVLVGETNCGKTAVMRAIEWVVRNRPLRPENELVSRQHPNECIVEIETERGIARRIWSKKFNGYELEDDQGKHATYRDLRGDVPPDLGMILNLGDINIQDQWSPTFLFDLSPGQVSRYISELLGFDPVDRGVARVKTWAQETSRDALRLDAELKAARAELEQLSFVDALVPKMARVEAKEQRLVQMLAAVTELKRAADDVAARRLEVKRLQESHATFDLESLQRKIDELGCLQAERDALVEAAESVHNARQSVSHFSEQYEECGREIEAARQKYADTLLELSVCPTCGGDVDRERVGRVAGL